MLKCLNVKMIKGFTLIEMLLAMTISVLVIGAVSAVFISSINSKQRIYQLKEIEDNARYAMELMSREIRMAQEIISDEAGQNDSELDFIDSSGTSVKFCRANQDGSCNSGGTYIARNTTTNNAITSSKVSVSNLIFYVNNFDLANGPQPRITITMTVGSGTTNMTFQTTISPRIY